MLRLRVIFIYSAYDSICYFFLQNKKPLLRKGTVLLTKPSILYNTFYIKRFPSLLGAHFINTFTIATPQQSFSLFFA